MIVTFQHILQKYPQAKEEYNQFLKANPIGPREPIIFSEALFHFYVKYPIWMQLTMIPPKNVIKIRVALLVPKNELTPAQAMSGIPQFQFFTMNINQDETFQQFFERLKQGHRLTGQWFQQYQQLVQKNPESDKDDFELGENDYGIQPR